MRVTTHHIIPRQGVECWRCGRGVEQSDHLRCPRCAASKLCAVPLCPRRPWRGGPMCSMHHSRWSRGRSKADPWMLTCDRCREFYHHLWPSNYRQCDDCRGSECRLDGCTRSRQPKKSGRSSWCSGHVKRRERYGSPTAYRCRYRGCESIVEMGEVMPDRYRARCSEHTRAQRDAAITD